MKSYDSIIIGGGHNALVCANYLAKSGQKVLIIEALKKFGGLAVDREFFPGYRANKASALNQFSEKIQKFEKRHEFKPGITGLAQISGFRGKIKNYHDMSSRVKLDRYYFKNWSLYLDFKIFFQTAFKLIRFNLS